MSLESYHSRSHRKSGSRSNSPGSRVNQRAAPAGADTHQSHSHYYSQAHAPQASSPAPPQRRYPSASSYPAPNRRRTQAATSAKTLPTLQPGGFSRPSAAAAASRVRSRRPAPPFVWAGGSAMLALMAFLMPHNFKASVPPQPEVCSQIVQAQSFLSRHELSQLLAVPERASREAVRQVVAEPYCLLPPLAVREGETAEREAYPLEFDPQTWLVLLYEGGEYAGYDFSFR